MTVLRAALLAGAGALALMSAPAHAVLIADGLTYSLTETTIDANTHQFVLSVSGINTASDTEGGRTGLNAVAFTQPSNFDSAVMIDPASFNFVLGGLASTGCNTTGNFFCFDNPAIPPDPVALLGSTFSLTFQVDTVGTFPTGYNPDLKIDWVGTQNNYDLVSLPVGTGTGNPPPPPPPPVPEPASLLLLGSSLVIAGAVGRYRRRNRG